MIPFSDSKLHQVMTHLKRVWNTNTLLPNPCPLPVSLEREHFDILIHHQKNSYVVSEKTDGIRYTLVIGNDYAVFVNRSLQLIDITIICNQSTALNGITVDGELILNEDDNYQFFIFDIMEEFGDLNIQQKNYIERMESISKIFLNDEFYKNNLNPYQYLQKNPNKIISTSVELLPKPCYRLIHFGTLLRQVIPMLNHDTDGFIFTPIYERVRRGRNINQWKWKFKHTIDLRFVDQNHRAFMLRDGTFWNETDDPYSPEYYIQIPSDWEIDHNALNHLIIDEKNYDLIIECDVVWISSPPVLQIVPYLIRTDKTIPNSKSTIEHTLASIQNAITLNELIIGLTK